MATARDRWLEILAVLCIGAAPDVFFSTAQACGAGAAPWTPTAHAVSVLLRAVWVSVPVLWILRRSGEPLPTFGLAAFRWADLWLGVVTLGAAVAVDLLVWPLFAGGAGPAAAVEHGAPAPVPLLLMMSAANGFAEELVVRAYLLTRLRPLLGALPALLLSTAVFTAYHTYLGAEGALRIAATGLVLGGTYLVVPRLWPVAVAHALLDAVALWP
ncbi:MAG: CPBP family intramembrane glutamic endopeptidase [Planctomycetota bacterium]